jgi:predicted dehydrogenase
MTEKRTRVGIVGAGFISDYHIRGLHAAGAEVPIISSRTEASARSKAGQFGIPGYTARNDEVFGRDDIDAVVIVTPDFTHKDITIAALEAGKPVMLQKPMARNTDECQQIIDAATRTGTPLFVSFMHRYFEEVVMMRALLAESVFGQIYSVRQRNATPGADWADWFYHKENVGGGAMMQLGVHGIDLLRYLFGEIEAVRATTAQLKSERILKDGARVTSDSEDTIFATYRFASGAMASHETNFHEMAGTDRFRMEIYGEGGTAWLRSERGDLSIYAPDYLKQTGWFQPSLPNAIHGARHHRHFMDMVNGDAKPDSSALDGLKSVAVCEAVYRSAESGQWESIT